MALPVIGGMQVRWLCAFCYTGSFRETYPPGWGRVVRAVPPPDLVETLDACPACVERLAAADGHVPRAAFAEGPDPSG
jgi:hypothetical protein